MNTDDLNAPGPTDDVILKNTLNIIEQQLKDIKKYGLDGTTSHDGPVLCTHPHTTNGQHMVWIMDHFIKTWKRRNHT